MSDYGDLILVAWGWFAVFRDEVVNDGISFGSEKPNFRNSVEGVEFVYLPLYTHKEELSKVEWKL